MYVWISNSSVCSSAHTDEADINWDALVFSAEALLDASRSSNTEEVIRWDSHHLHQHSKQIHNQMTINKKPLTPCFQGLNQGFLLPLEFLCISGAQNKSNNTFDVSLKCFYTSMYLVMCSRRKWNAVYGTFVHVCNEARDVLCRFHPVITPVFLNITWLWGHAVLTCVC